MKSKVIIWGHKSHNNTFYYIHNSYFNAFKYLGYDTFWLDENDDIGNQNFENCIFLTEGHAQKGIPLNKSSRYILHHSNLDKFINAGCNFINLCNYVHDCRLGKSFNYNQDGETGNTVEKINYYSYYDKKNKALYQPWATNLMPNEISNEVIPYDENKKYIYYVGSISKENKILIKKFKKSCKLNHKKFKNINHISESRAQDLIIDSYIAPDIRLQHHINVGYVACRIFKNISYGMIPATNSKLIRDFFGVNTLPYGEADDIFDANKDYVSNIHNLEHSKWLMNEVREHHTFATRIKTILSIF